MHSVFAVLNNDSTTSSPSQGLLWVYVLKYNYDFTNVLVHVKVCYLWCFSNPLHWFVSSRLQRILMVSCASDHCLVQLCLFLRTTAWSPLETCQWPPSTLRGLMRDCCTSWHITMPCTSLTQSVFPHFCQYCKQKFSKIPFMSKIWPLPTKKALASGSPSLSEWVSLFLVCLFLDTASLSISCKTFKESQSSVS